MQLNCGGEVFVGPHRLPSGLREDLTLDRVADSLAGSDNALAIVKQLAMDMDTEYRMLQVMKLRNTALTIQCRVCVI